MAARQRRVSWAPSAVTVPISSSAGTWPSRSGSMELSPSRLGVSTARMPDVAVSIARCTRRHRRRPCGACLRARHSPSPRNLMPPRRLARTGGAHRLDVDQQVQRPVRAAVGDLHGQGLSPPAQGREVRHRPVQPRQPEQARHHPGGPPQRKPEQHLDRQVRAGSRRPRPPPAGRAARHATHARPSPDPPRSAASPAGAGRRCRLTSSSHGGGQRGLRHPDRPILPEPPARSLRRQGSATCITAPCARGIFEAWSDAPSGADMYPAS